MTPVNHWKLGLFVVLGLFVFCLSIVGLGANKLRRDTETFVTFFDESVQGLSVGSPVKFRGVSIGEVALITVASDRRHVQVECRVDVAILEHLGLRRPGEVSSPPDNVRAQIVSQGITGVRFLGIDFFDTEEFKEPELGFEVPTNYIPAAKSTLANLEEALDHARRAGRAEARAPRRQEAPRGVPAGAQGAARAPRGLFKADGAGPARRGSDRSGGGGAGERASHAGRAEAGRDGSAPRR